MKFYMNSVNLFKSFILKSLILVILCMNNIKFFIPFLLPQNLFYSSIGYFILDISLDFIYKGPEPVVLWLIYSNLYFYYIILIKADCIFFKWDCNVCEILYGVFWKVKNKMHILLNLNFVMCFHFCLQSITIASFSVYLNTIWKSY